MKKEELFLNSISHDQKDFLNLLDLTAKVHGEKKETSSIEDSFLWDENFFHVANSKAWNSLESEKQNKILRSMTENILRESYFIEAAGMAYAAKMNMTSTTKEERQFFCFVSEEEAKHLRLVESLFDFDKTNKMIPSFSMLIGEIIQDADRISHLLLIQILLEGWGLNYYKSLAKGTLNEKVSLTFKAILKDEIRHHSAGLILFSKDKNAFEKSLEDKNQIINYIDKICKMIQIGPFALCSEVFKHFSDPSSVDMTLFLKEIDAVKTTSQKLQLIEELISKVLNQDIIKEMRERNFFTSPGVEEMALLLVESMPEIFQHQPD